MQAFNNRININQPNFKKENEKSVNRVSGVGAALVGLGIKDFITYTKTPVSKIIIKRMQEISDLPQNDIDTLHKASENALKEVKLDNKVTIKWIKEKEGESELKLLCKNATDYESLIQSYSPVRFVEKCKNAYFSLYNISIQNPFSNDKIAITEANHIYMPENKLSFAAFHEIGHAMNYNLSKFWKIVQQSRPASIILPEAILLYSIFTRKSKAGNNEELSTKQKIKNFIRNNAGILSFTTMIPMLAEEGKATLNGKKLAKKLLSEDLYKNVIKGSKTAYLSYLATAIITALGITAAIKVKDKIIENKEKSINTNK